MKRSLAILLVGACLAGPSGLVGAAPVSKPPARPPGPRPTAALPPATTSPTAELVADLANVDPAIRKTAEQKLAKLPKQAVIASCVGLVDGRLRASENPDRMASASAVALDLLVRLDPKQAGTLALGQLDTTDPFVREAAGTIVAQMDDDVAVPFLSKALVAWGTENTAGMHAVVVGLGRDKRADAPAARAAIIAVLTQQPLPQRNPKFVYDNEHDTPRDGDQYRCWQYKADGCLELVALHPFAEANDGVRRCLLIDELRVAAALAFARLGQADAAPVIRSWLDRDDNSEHRLGLYRALFIVGGDNDKDRLAARDIFTATQAPSAAWVLGLRAMVELFDRRSDEPALRVVSAWKLRGEAAQIRAAALEAMKAAHPDVYEKVVGKSYVPPVRPQ